MRSNIRKYYFIIAFFISLLITFFTKQQLAVAIWNNFYSFFLTMIKFIPAVFILIGLFDVWVDKKTIKKHLGNNSSPLAYIWIIMLAATTVGGLYVAFPVAAALAKKGARPRIIFSYLGLAAVCRIPMTLFEATYLGYTFTALRWLISIPLIIGSSICLEKLLKKTNFKTELSGP